MNKKTRDRHIINLYACCDIKVEFSCDKCDREETIQEDQESAAFEAYCKGWRSTDKYTYCPKCAKKIKKK